MSLKIKEHRRTGRGYVYPDGLYAVGYVGREEFYVAVESAESALSEIIKEYGFLARIRYLENLITDDDD